MFVLRFELYPLVYNKTWAIYVDISVVTYNATFTTDINVYYYIIYVAHVLISVLNSNSPHPVSFQRRIVVRLVRQLFENCEESAVRIFRFQPAQIVYYETFPITSDELFGIVRTLELLQNKLFVLFTCSFRTSEWKRPLPLSLSLSHFHEMSK